MRDGGMRGLEGRFANRETMHRASSMSLKASMNEGYLNKYDAEAQ